MLIKNVNIIDDDKIFNGSVLIKDGKIKAIGSDFETDKSEAILDGKGLYLSSGFIDLHIHGGGNASAMGGVDSILKMCEAHARFGTTSILPTTLSAPVEKLKQAILDVKEAQSKSDVNILGIHLEGPFLSPEMCGAQSCDTLLVPSETNYNELLNLWDGIKMMGIAPELNGAFTLSKELSKRGIVASVAHSNASYEVAEEAFSNGFSDVTHIYCACSANHKEGAFRKAGVVEAGLVSDCTVQVIADLKHLPVGILKLIYKCKGADKMYLITDGLEFSASDLNEGEIVTQENGVKVKFENGVMKIADGTRLAGSVSTMNTLVRNMYKTVGVPLFDAVKMATSTPSSVLGIDKTKGKVKEGYDADLILFDDDINVKTVIIDGKII